VTYIKSTKNTETLSHPRYIIALTALLFNLIMLIFPKETFSAAKNGLLLWQNKALPSLLPFIIVTNIMCNSGFADMVKRPFTPLCRFLFSLSGISVLPIITGFISGCPLGAKTTCDLYKSGKLTKSEATHLLCFVNNSSPLFIVSTVGIGMLGSAKSGFKIMFLCYTSAILTGILLRFSHKSDTPLQNCTKKQNTACAPSNLLSNAVWDGMETILKIGGCIILFCVITQSLNIIIMKLFPSNGTLAKTLCLISGAALEVTNGAHILSNQKNAVLLCACAISWGGISIHTQSADFIHSAGLKMTPYIIGKLFQTLLTLVLGLIFP
jgi:sporulation integral membrane protein YlbJ